MPHMAITSCADMDNYVSIYTSYGFTGMNVTSIWPSTNMAATLHVYVPLHIYCSLHIDPTLLQTSIQNQ